MAETEKAAAVEPVADERSFFGAGPPVEERTQEEERGALPAKMRTGIGAGGAST